MSELPSRAPQRQVSPCPFCGATWGTGLTAAYGGQPATSWHIHCSPCRVSGPRVEGGSTESIGIAIDLWNRRTPPSETVPTKDAFSRVIELIEAINSDRYGKPLMAALHLCNDLADELSKQPSAIEPRIPVGWIARKDDGANLHFSVAQGWRIDEVLTVASTDGGAKK